MRIRCSKFLGSSAGFCFGTNIVFGKHDLFIQHIQILSNVFAYFCLQIFHVEILPFYGTVHLLFLQFSFVPTFSFFYRTFLQFNCANLLKLKLRLTIKVGNFFTRKTVKNGLFLVAQLRLLFYRFFLQ